MERELSENSLVLNEYDRTLKDIPKEEISENKEIELI